jgi:exonuclease III
VRFFINNYEKELFNIEGYYSIMSLTKFNKADGVMFYICESLEFEQINIPVELSSLNYVAICQIDKEYDTIYINIYRQQNIPRQIYYQEFVSFLQKIPSHSNTKIVICGDMNVNIAGNTKIPQDEIENYMNILNFNKQRKKQSGSHNV